MLAHRLRRWSNIRPTFGQRLMLAGMFAGHAHLRVHGLTESARGSSLYVRIFRLILTYEVILTYKDDLRSQRIEIFLMAVEP